MANEDYINAIEQYGFVTFAGVIYALSTHTVMEYHESDQTEYYQSGIAPNGEEVIIDYDSEMEPFSVSLAS